ncbi:hypothetical protein M440DRAFT_1423038 [Trichoderma longibrachiatum ATCC 18648]|uniref:Apple domain-containing protein n=1 Tax=Trichoderma longibrachiatum ATCC 18648 TaxID=983965 RepID=A0A2T4C351_TRILO|nr:hypothetical protein M440DRAFT_1423038 [Trichoderma longibrachiatum ATCC 18648]
MAPTYDDAPQLAEGHDLPEAYVSHPHAEQVWSPQPSIAPTYISQPSTVAYSNNNETYPDANAGVYGTTGPYSDAAKGAAVGGVGGVTGAPAGGDAAYAAAPPESTVPPGKKTAATVCGISLVLLLSIIIAILSAAVIGLAAGTGVATKNYNDAHSQLQVLSSSLAVAQAEATGTPTASAPLPSGTPDFNNITNGCSDDPDSVTGNIYTSKFFGKPHFTMYCNKDTVNPSMFSVFAPDFNGCMDACAAWNSYNKTTKGSCVAVSFIPAWSSVAVAVAGNAPGDCYLKPGPQTKANLTDPNIGTECHAALVLK